MHKSHTCHRHTPKQHDYREKDGGFELLQKNLSDRFEDGIRDEKDRQRVVILIVRHLQVLLQAVDFGVSDVCSVEKCNEIQEREPWNEFEIKLPQQLAILQTGLSVSISHT